MRWNRTDLAELQSEFAHRMRHLAMTPLSGDGLLVRGVVEPPSQPDIARIVIWDGRSLDTSIAYDLPLTDHHGANVPTNYLVTALRGHLAQQQGHPPAIGTLRDAFGIPLQGTPPPSVNYATNCGNRTMPTTH